jgi:TrkA domain protein
MVELSEAKLPGVGVRYDLVTAAGPRVGVLVHRSGRRDLLLYSERDPSACDRTVELDPDESLALAELLGATHVAEQLEALQQDVQGLAIDWIRVEAGSEWAGHRLGEAAVHTTTGVSVVAILGPDGSIAAPGPDAVLAEGATAVAVGSPEGIAQLVARLRRG